MAERFFTLDSREARLDAATARRQPSPSLAVGFAVLAAAGLVESPADAFRGVSAPKFIVTASSRPTSHSPRRHCAASDPVSMRSSTRNPATEAGVRGGGY